MTRKEKAIRIAVIVTAALALTILVAWAGFVSGAQSPAVAVAAQSPAPMAMVSFASAEVPADIGAPAVQPDEGQNATEAVCGGCHHHHHHHGHHHHGSGHCPNCPHHGDH